MRARLPSLATPAPARPSPTSEPAAGHVGLWPGLLLVTVVLLYAPTLGYDWLEVGDAALRAPASLDAAWHAGGLGGLSLFLESSIGGGASALPARLVALLLHAAASALVFGLGLRLGLARGSALLLAALFAVHPLRVEPVAWLSQRAALLGGCLFLLGAWIQLGDARARRLLAGLALTAALLAEPRLWLGVPWLGLVRHWLGPTRLARREAVGLAGVTLLGLAALALQPAPFVAPELTLATRLAHLPLAAGELAFRWLAPLALSPSHAHPALAADPVSLGLGWLRWLGLLLPLAALVLHGGRAPRMTLGGLLFLAVASTSLLAPRSSALFRETDAYLAALGLELALVAGLELLGTSARLRLGLGTALVLLCGAGAWLRTGAWRSEEELRTRALAANPEDAEAHVALASWHLAHGRLSAAQRACERALAAEPAHRPARLQLGELALRRALLPGQEQHLRTAEAELQRCALAGALDARVAACLGEVYQRGGDFERARAELTRAVALAPRDGLAWARLGMVELRLARLAEARTAFERASASLPRGVEGWCGLGIVAFQQNELEAARAYLEHALALEPEHVESRATLGRIQELTGATDAAETSYRRALGVNPDNVDALYALGARLALAGRVDEALRYLERVVALARERPHVRATLESARLRMARGEREIPLQRLRAVLAFNPGHDEARALLESLEGAAGGR